MLNQVPKRYRKISVLVLLGLGSLMAPIVLNSIMPAFISSKQYNAALEEQALLSKQIKVMNEMVASKDAIKTRLLNYKHLWDKEDKLLGDTSEILALISKIAAECNLMFKEHVNYNGQIQVELCGTYASLCKWLHTVEANIYKIKISTAQWKSEYHETIRLKLNLEIYNQSA